MESVGLDTAQSIGHQHTARLTASEFAVLRSLNAVDQAFVRQALYKNAFNMTLAAADPYSFDQLEHFSVLVTTINQWGFSYHIDRALTPFGEKVLYHRSLNRLSRTLQRLGIYSVKQTRLIALFEAIEFVPSRRKQVVQDLAMALTKVPDCLNELNSQPPEDAESFRVILRKHQVEHEPSASLDDLDGAAQMAGALICHILASDEIVLLSRFDQAIASALTKGALHLQQKPDGLALSDAVDSRHFELNAKRTRDGQYLFHIIGAKTPFGDQMIQQSSRYRLALDLQAAGVIALDDDDFSVFYDHVCAMPHLAGSRKLQLFGLSIYRSPNSWDALNAPLPRTLSERASWFGEFGFVDDKTIASDCVHSALLMAKAIHTFFYGRMG